MEMADSGSDLLFIDVDASTPAVKQEQTEETTDFKNTRRMPSEEQVLLLIESMERNPELARGSIRTAAGRARARRVWDQLKYKLNAADGVRKNSSQWMKYWTDKKTFVKKKAAEGELELTSIEEKILYLCVGVAEPRVKKSADDMEGSLAHSDISDNDVTHTPNLTAQSAPTDNTKTDTKYQQGQTSFEKILKIEEKRLSLEQSNAQLMRTILEQSAEKERTILSAVRSLSERVNERNERDREMAGALKVLGEGLALARRVRPSSQPRFKCAACSYVTYHRALFREHTNRHDGIKPYKCELCPYSSVSKKYVKQHQARHRSCVCGYVAKNTKQYRQHRATCGGEAPDVARCNKCRREYVDEKALAKHSAHVQSCPLCSRPLCAGSLRSHLATEHQVVNKPKRFVCIECGWWSVCGRGTLLHLIHHPQRAAVDVSLLTRCGIII